MNWILNTVECADDLSRAAFCPARNLGFDPPPRVGIGNCHSIDNQQYKAGKLSSLFRQHVGDLIFPIQEVANVGDVAHCQGSRASFSAFVNSHG